MLSRIKGGAQLAASTEQHQRSLTTRTFTRVLTRGGKKLHHTVAAASGPTIVYKAGTKDKTMDDRQISANIIHGSDPEGGLEDGATEFFSAKRTHGVYRYRQRLMPAWERMAQGLIIMTRNQPRVFPEMAFRTMAIFLKMLMVVRVTETKMLLLPGQSAQNMENVVAAAKFEAEQKSAEKKDSSGAPPSASADEEAKK